MKHGHRLKELIEASGITQKKFAAEIGIAPSTLNGYINSTREADLEMIVQFAGKLNVSIDFLLNYCAKADDTLIMSPEEVQLMKKFPALNSFQKSSLINYLDFLTLKKP